MVIGIIYSIISILLFYLLNKYKCCGFNLSTKDDFCTASIIVLLWPTYIVIILVFYIYFKFIKKQCI